MSSNRIKCDNIQIGNNYVLPIEQSNVTLSQAKVKKIIEETDAKALQIISGAENKSNIISMCDLLFGMVDVCSFMLILLPLYPNTVDEFVYSVNLLTYAETTSYNRFIYWILFVSLIMTGVVKILMIKLKLNLLLLSIFYSYFKYSSKIYLQK